MRTCKDCGKPIYWVDDLSAWYHWSLPDMLACGAVVVTPRKDPPGNNVAC